MSEVLKRPQVIRDLIDIATYIAVNNLDSGDRFLYATEETFKQLGQMPQLGKQCQFTNSRCLRDRTSQIMLTSNLVQI